MSSFDFKVWDQCCTVSLTDWQKFCSDVKQGCHSEFVVIHESRCRLTSEAMDFFSLLGYKHDADVILDMRIVGIVMSKDQAMQFRLRFL